MKKDDGGYSDHARVEVVRHGVIRVSPSKTFASLLNPVYRLYFIGMTGQWTSMNMQMVTRSLLLYQLTGSGALLGLMSLANALPQLFLGFFGGVIADRVQKKYVLLAGLASSALVSLSIALTLTMGLLSSDRPGSWWILFGCALLQGTIMGLMMPSRQTIINEIVREDEIMNALALNALGMNTFRFLAPVIAGFLIDGPGFAAVYYTMTGMYLMGAAFIAFMPLTGTMAIRGEGALRDLIEGFQYVRREKILLFVLGFTLFAVLLSQPYMQLMPMFTEDILKVGAKGLGILMSVSGIGAMVGALIVASMPNRNRGALLLLSSLILAVGLAVFSFSRSWSLSIGLMLVVGLGQTGRMTFSNTLLQSYTEPGFLGRIMSFNMMEHGLTSFGTFAAGMLAEAFGPQWAVGGFAAVLVVLSLLTFLFVPRIRKLQ